VDDILFKPEVTARDLIRKAPEAFKDLKTPYYMLDLDRIKHNISLLKKHLRPDKILYAVENCNIE